MGVTFKREQRAQIYAAICTFLRKTRVKSGSFLNWDTIPAEINEIDSIIPSNSQLKDTLFNYVHEFAVREFVTDFVAAELADHEELKLDADECLLFETNRFSDVHENAERIIKELETLPWTYTLSLQLPEAVSSSFDHSKLPFALSDTISFSLGRDLEATYPLQTRSEVQKRRISHEIGEGLPSEWVDHSVYLQVKASGYVGPFIGKTPQVIALDEMKSVLGLLIASNALNVEVIWETPFPIDYLYVHRLINDINDLMPPLEIPRTTSLVLQRLRPGEMKRKESTDTDRKNLFMKTISAFAPVFSGGRKTENLRAACRWLFDSNGTRDPLLQYVQTMVVLEILLGSQKNASELSIGDTISNRCAYLIGSNWKDRQEILDDFKEIYAVRSQIVHRGKSRLSHAERLLLTKLQDLSRRVILEETKRMPS